MLGGTLLYRASERGDLVPQNYRLWSTPRSGFIDNPLCTIHFRHAAPPNTQLALYADDTGILAQSWRTDTIVHRLTHATSILLRFFTRWKLQVNIHKTEAILFTRRRPATPARLHFQHTAIPWNSQVRYLGLLLDPKLLFTRHLTSVLHKATGTLCQLFPLLARHSTLSIPNKITVQIMYPRCADIRCPFLEQHINLQLSPSANFAVQMSPRY